MAAEKNCGDRSCSMDYRFVSNCVTYIDSAEGLTCDYPCSFKNCVSELHHFVMCPVWSCTEKTTTTTPSPTDFPTLSPMPTHPSLCSSEVCLPSVIFNALFAITFIGLAFFVWIRRKRSNSLAIANPLFDDAEFGFGSERPIIRNAAERLPLLTPRPQRSFNVASRSFTRGVSNPAQPSSESASLPNFYEQIATAFVPHPAPAVQETAF